MDRGGSFVLRLVATMARIVFGLALASLGAGLITVLFVDVGVLTDPANDLPKTIGETIDLALLAATHIAIFSFLFVFIAAAIGEWFSIRVLSFYLLVGVIIALLGFTAQYMSEVAGQPTIFNNYAVKTFVTVGFFAGFIYWLAAGQFAGRTPPAAARSEPSSLADRESTDAEVVITRPPAPEKRTRWHMPVLERLKFASREPGKPLRPAPDAEQDPSGGE
jgi:hypothetical protein